MTTESSFHAARAALDDAEAALAKLDGACCDPRRSPSMQALATTLATARTGLDRVEDESGPAAAALAGLEDAGAQIGRLQVGCCAPDRLPLYTRILGDLTSAQLSLNRALETGH